ncbi:MAG: tRNA dimethylallyltransferase [Pseudomonadota bacterium]|jgi:tRNA dimethylallyltransferase
MKERPIRPCLALVGPTASGKTALALEIARHWPVDIISVDSALVYRGMDIGTAKPNAEEQAQVRHHLIDIRDPLDAYSAADFARDARELIHQIQARGRHPLLVGGTMLYLKALMDGLDELPQADARLRAEIEARAQALGWPALHAELAQVDPASAARLAPRDAQRIGRALEVWHLTGQPLSALWGQARTQHESPLTPKQLISLEPLNRAWLHARIERRFELMLAQGFLQEMQDLRARGDLHPELPSMRCVGYRQAWAWLDALQAQGRSWVDADPSDMIRQGQAATRQLAKRQLTWLRSLPERQCVACDAEDVEHQVLAQVTQAWGPP